MKFYSMKDITVIIPYKEDRGYLQQAIDSVPEGCQLLLAKGNGTWPQNFNKVLPQATGLKTMSLLIVMNYIYSTAIG